MILCVTFCRQSCSEIYRIYSISNSSWFYIHDIRTTLGVSMEYLILSLTYLKDTPFVL